jgi:hypothetical protein
MPEETEARRDGSARTLFLRDGKKNRDDEREIADAGDELPRNPSPVLISISTGMKKNESWSWYVTSN